MNQYEMVLILKAGLEEDERNQVLDRLKDAINQNLSLIHI